ncbi:DgyrCDS5730 [Dimorphilus gyrociliatus]|uniref:DgyrCDS5730 n=1 Tax=Dimorphilus gyrociliatus TaxID=2664684 RepID=A0A7I8VLD5_9ANNE|nr:DgyrCDS5730 [Dimorphilus gyrociliatus]
MVSKSPSEFRMGIPLHLILDNIDEAFQICISEIRLRVENFRLITDGRTKDFHHFNEEAKLDPKLFSSAKPNLKDLDLRLKKLRNSEDNVVNKSSNEISQQAVIERMSSNIELVNKLLKRLLEITMEENIQLSSRNVIIHSIPFNKCDVLPHLIVQNNRPSQMSVCASLEGKRCSCLLIEGDVTENFKHTGYKAYTNFATVKPELVEKPNWVGKVIDMLKKLSINVIISKGKIDDDLASSCEGLGILCIANVPTNILRSIAKTSNCDAGAYIFECTKDHVANDIEVKPWRDYWKFSFQKTNIGEDFIYIKAPNCNFQTVIFGHPVEQMRRLIESELLHKLNNLSYLLYESDSISTVSNGNIELLCCKRLEKVMQKDVRGDLNEVKYCVFESIRDCLEEYAFIQNTNNLHLNDAYPQNTASFTSAVLKEVTFMTSLLLVKKLALISNICQTGIKTDVD